MGVRWCAFVNLGDFVDVANSFNFWGLSSMLNL